jgi:hypothetical protein
MRLPPAQTCKNIKASIVANKILRLIHGGKPAPFQQKGNIDPINGGRHGFIIRISPTEIGIIQTVRIIRVKMIGINLSANDFLYIQSVNKK